MSERTGKQVRQRFLRKLAATLVPVLAGTAVVAAALAAPAPARADVTTNSGDKLLTSWYGNQPKLAPSVVTGETFGQLGSADVDGQVYGQPLVSKGVLVVATASNNVYGLNATTGERIWSKNFGTPFTPNQYFSSFNQCSDISPTVGVISTPVIDAATDTVYLTSKELAPGSTDQRTVKYQMHALSTVDGTEKPGFPVTMGGTADNDPTHTFVAGTELQRPGLLLLDGVVYAAFAGHCDNGPYEGWVIGVSTAGAIKARWSAEAGVPQNSSPPAGAGIWQSGGGLLADEPGSFYIASGNGYTSTEPTPGKQPPNRLGQSVVKLGVQPDGTLKPKDYFSPFNGAALNGTDSDIGSGPAVELPNSDALPGSPFGTAEHQKIVLQVGKGGYFFVLDGDDLGGFMQGPGGGDATINTVQSYGVWGKPSVWPGDGGWVYLTTAAGGGGSGSLKAYKYGLDADGKPTFALKGRSSGTFGYGSSSPVITSEGLASTSALVWTIWAPDASGVGAQLQAYRPVPVNGTLEKVWSTPIGTSNKFTQPTADNGKIYVGTRDGHVLIYGSPVNAPLHSPALEFPPTVVGDSRGGTVHLTANGDVTVSSLRSTSNQFVVGTPTPALPAVLHDGDVLDVPITFTPGVKGAIGGSLVASTTEGALTQVPLSGSGQAAGPDLSIYPCCLMFGGVPVGSSVEETVTFTNEGAAPMHVTSTDPPSAPYSATDMPAVGSTIASGRSVTAKVKFTPTSVGRYTNQLSIVTDGGTKTVSLDGVGGTEPKMEVSTTEVKYGSVPVGATATQTFTVRNIGGTPLTITRSKPPAGAGGFTADPESAAALAEGNVIQPGATITARVKFTPQANGPITSAWSLNANDGVGEVRTVSFTGTGITGPKPTVIVGDTDVTVPSSGTTTADFPVYLVPGPTPPLTVKFSSHDGSAKASAGQFTPVKGVAQSISSDQPNTVSVKVNSSTTPMTNLKFSLSADAPGAEFTTVQNGTAWLNTTEFRRTYVIAEPATAWRSPSEDTTVEVPIRLQSATSTDTKLTINTSDGTAVAGTDYTPATSLKITVPAESTVFKVPIRILRGAAGSATPRTFTVTVSGAKEPVKIAEGQSTVTIYPATADTSVPPPPEPLQWNQKTPSDTATVGALYAYKFATSGTPSPTFRLGDNSELPPGIELDSTGILAGEPSKEGDYTFTVVASNGAGPDLTTEPIKVHVAAVPEGPSFTAADPPSVGNVGQPYSYTFAAAGEPDPTFAVSSGSLPDGLTLDAETGVLSGTPTTAGDYVFTVSADNGINVPAQSNQINLTIRNGLQFVSPATTQAPIGQPFSFDVEASGTPAPTVSLVAGNLPSGVTYTPGPAGKGKLSGTIPAGTAPGDIPLTFRAENSLDQRITQAFILKVQATADMSATLSGTKTVSVGSQVTYTVTSTNNGPSTATAPTTATFVLPEGTTFVSATNCGVLSGNTVTWSLGALASGKHIGVKVVITAATKGTIVVRGTAGSSLFDPDPANNVTTWSTSVR